MSERVVSVVPEVVFSSCRISGAGLFGERCEADMYRVAKGTGLGQQPSPFLEPSKQRFRSSLRKALVDMTTQTDSGPRRIRAAMIGFGIDTSDSQNRLTTSEQCVMVGGSDETHSEMVETVLRLESELERRGQRLGDVSPAELADIAWRIDSPELHAIALRLYDGLSESGLSFHEASAEELDQLLS